MLAIFSKNFLRLLSAIINKFYHCKKFCDADRVKSFKEYDEITVVSYGDPLPSVGLDY